MTNLTLGTWLWLMLAAIMHYMEADYVVVIIALGVSSMYHIADHLLREFKS